MADDFRDELIKLINHHSRENVSNTPDFLLGQYLLGCLELFESTVYQRESWYGHHYSPGGVVEQAASLRQ